MINLNFINLLPGNGFWPNETTVRLGGTSCIVKNVTIEMLTCITQEKMESSPKVQVKSNHIDYPENFRYEYVDEITPKVYEVSPLEGKLVFNNLKLFTSCT